MGSALRVGMQLMEMHQGLPHGRELLVAPRMLQARLIARWFDVLVDQDTWGGWVKRQVCLSG